MKKEQMEQETRAKCAYVPPKIEVYAVEACRPLASSPFTATHIRGDADTGGGLAGHLRGDADSGSDGNGFAIHIRGNAEYWE